MRAYPRSTDPVVLARFSSRVRGFHAYWDARRDGRFAPSRADLSPLEMKPWLPGISIVDVVSFPDRLVYRLVGTANVDARGSDPTGRTVIESYYGRSLPEVLENYRIVVQDRSLVIDWDNTPTADRWFVEDVTLLCPLSSDGVGVDKVIVFCEYQTAPRQRAD
jgi:hypothetical protein